MAPLVPAMAGTASAVARPPQQRWRQDAVLAPASVVSRALPGAGSRSSGAGRTGARGRRDSEARASAVLALAAGAKKFLSGSRGRRSGVQGRLRRLAVATDKGATVMVHPLGSFAGHSREELLEVADVAVQGFFVSCYDAETRPYAPDEDDIRLLEEQVYDDLALRYGPGGGGVLLIARDDAGNITGCIGVERTACTELPVSVGTRLPYGIAGEPTEEEHPVAYMSNLAVRAEQRGRGVARRLIAEAEQQVQLRMRLREVVLMVNERNEPAKRLYESLGYQPAFDDLWASRAMPVCGGGMGKTCVRNIGYLRKLGPLPPASPKAASARAATAKAARNSSNGSAPVQSGTGRARGLRWSQMTNVLGSLAGALRLRLSGSRTRGDIGR